MTEKIRNQVSGAMFGLAVGDALGGPTEFLTQERITAQYGYVTEMIGGGINMLSPGETTDDTAMTLAVAKGILKKPNDPIEAIGTEFLRWNQTDPKDIGMTIRYTLHFYHREKGLVCSFPKNTRLL